jgi:phenylalanyl-tRNA synthetase alpha chain
MPDTAEGLREKLKKVKAQATEAIREAEDLNAVESLRVRFLGKKGEITAVLKGLKNLPSEEKPKIGQLANEVRDAVQSQIQEGQKDLKEKILMERLEKEAEDLSIPGRLRGIGSIHPLSQVISQCERIFRSLGFELADGPEVETDFYNFEALNIPENHPARDEQDTFFLDTHTLLRTQTSSVQIRVMKDSKPPLRIICPGAVYRSDDDATHSPMFHQIEGLWVDENVSFGHLKGVLGFFAREFFGPNTEVRLRPSYFPFTEPSAEVDVSCPFCSGEGCRVCKKTGWIEILGSGLVDPEVFKAVDFDPEKVSGFAFGMGVERIALLKLGVPDLRLFFQSDARFLDQF